MRAVSMKKKQQDNVLVEADSQNALVLVAVMFSHSMCALLECVHTCPLCIVHAGECKSNLYFKLDNKIIVIISI